MSVKKPAAAGARTARRSAPRSSRRSTVPGDADARIRHVVLLMMENRSFDHALAGLQARIPGIDGAGTGSPRFNLSAGGTRVEQVPGPPSRVRPDPEHDTKSVLAQIAGGAMDGFVTDYETGPPVTGAAEWPAVMRHHADGRLPALHALAGEFTTCNRWFASVPGPTWTNRLFALSGTSKGIVTMPSGPLQLLKHRYDQPSVFRRLTEAGRSWRVYFGDFPLALLLRDVRKPSAARHFARMRHFQGDVAGPERDFPAFTLIEPNYLGGNANDDHPPTDMAHGQALMARVYRALRSNEELWASTLLVITYDEHGGFYDHVPPPAAVPPDGFAGEFAFDRLGVRVPAVLVSPWIDAGVTDTVFDHCSLLRFMQLRWGLGDMGRRVALSADLGDLLRATPRRRLPSSVPGELQAASIRRLATAAAAQPALELNDHQRAIVALSESLEDETKPPAATRGLRAAAMSAGPRAQAKVAETRALEYLGARGARL